MAQEMYYPKMGTLNVIKLSLSKVASDGNKTTDHALVSQQTLEPSGGCPFNLFNNVQSGPVYRKDDRTDGSDTQPATGYITDDH